MKLTDLKIYKFELPLIRVLLLKNIKLTTRSGLMICLTDDRGNSGYGEISPLPGLHKENVHDVLLWLQKNRQHILQIQFPRECRKLSGVFEELLAPLAPPPSVRFGTEMAVLNLFSAEENTSLSRLLSHSPQETVYINGLLAGTEKEILTAAKTLVDEGYQTIKLKVGAKDMGREIQIVKKVRDIIGDKTALRLDANRAWTLTEAVQFGKSIADQKIEYIEEPLKDFSETKEFFRETKIPVAMDETLLQFDFENKKIPFGVKSFIIKPGVLGGIEKSVRLVERAKNLGLMPVLSSAFYSGAGLAVLVQLAAAFIPGQIAMGLDTYKWLKNDVLIKPFAASYGKIKVEDISRQSFRINRNVLQSL